MDVIPAKILESVELGSMPDIEYFRQKLSRGIEQGQSVESLEKVRRQLALLEDAIVIYHEHRLGEKPLES